MLTPPVSQSDHILGAADAPVNLVEYGDFECPLCGRAHLIVQDILERLSGHMQFVFRHFPLSQAHPHALSSAEASEAAGAQGAFWPMHDALFESQDALLPDDLVAYASDLGLDVDRFTTELAGGVYRPKVRSDFRSGLRSGVNGTPTFFVDGVRFDGNWADGTLTLVLANMIRAKSHAAIGASSTGR